MERDFNHFKGDTKWHFYVRIKFKLNDLIEENKVYENVM